VLPLHGDPDEGEVVGVRAFVEGYDDVRAEVLLDEDGFFGGETVRGIVHVGLEDDAIVVNFAGLGQREDLVAARVGQHGSRPLHKLVQAAHLTHQFVAGGRYKW
jgi:hypothetical protein